MHNLRKRIMILRWFRWKRKLKFKKVSFCAKRKSSSPSTQINVAAIVHLKKRANNLAHWNFLQLKWNQSYKSIYSLPRSSLSLFYRKGKTVLRIRKYIFTYDGLPNVIFSSIAHAYALRISWNQCMVQVEHCFIAMI